MIIDENGIFCPYGKFYLDAKHAVDTVVVSHAHGDHAVPGCGAVYTTAPTKYFMDHRYGKRSGKQFHIIGDDEPFIINNVVLTFYPAGHMLGSVSVLMVYRGVRYLYTGDYKLQEDETCDPVHFVQADVLITESTFANPSIRHPDPIEEIMKLNTTTFPILLGTYALGKAQRLTALINTYCPQKTVLLHHSIIPFHRIYERFGFTRWNYLAYNRKQMKGYKEDLIYLVPPLTFNSYFKASNLLKVFASGWKRLQERNNIELFISDHVDWYDIKETIAVVKPREIWTLHGDGKYLSEFYDDRISVKHL
ncbi:MBL fold metallo-hydrolase [Olivibacter sp. SDN3]|uniref:MBL fold metallo-hydrolase n=1 Tax=Olivibacter sp. SDN3 TaxID=2764720 RepID=UPI002107DF8C|nr:MBL fold metallo-hydrolase [Olivibacter sp. SDN3]